MEHLVFFIMIQCLGRLLLDFCLLVAGGRIARHRSVVSLVSPPEVDLVVAIGLVGSPHQAAPVPPLDDVPPVLGVILFHTCFELD